MSNTSLLGSFGGQAGESLMFRNRLINASSFDIWQRGTSFSSLAAYTYTADRWLTDGAVTTVARSGTQNNIMQVVTQAGTGIAQRIETAGGNFYAGQVYTVSGRVNCSVANLTVTVTYRAGNTFKSTIHTATVSSQLTAGAYSYFTTSFTLANAPTDFAGTDCIQVSFTSSVVNTINFESAQVEQGPTATPFERRPYSVELGMCQRYFYSAVRGSYPGAVAAIAYSTSAIVCSFSFPVQLRKDPSAGDIVFSYNGAANTVGNINTAGAVAASPNQVWTYKNGTLGFPVATTPFTVGLAYGFDITVNAEL